MPNNCDFLEHMNNEYNELTIQSYTKGPFLLPCPIFLLNTISGAFFFLFKAASTAYGNS